jgi:uncharacterized protein with HEPN domain
MKDSIGDEARIMHITECIEEIKKSLEGYDFEKFSNNHVLRIAVVKWLEIIGEAANHITEQTKNKNPQIEWLKMIGLRNIVVHEYFRIDYRIIWDAATFFLDELEREISTLNFN